MLSFVNNFIDNEKLVEIPWKVPLELLQYIDII